LGYFFCGIPEWEKPVGSLFLISVDKQALFEYT